MADPAEILEFWLDEVGPKGWFGGDAALDDTCRIRFAALLPVAQDGGLDHWISGSTGALAFVILTDQLSRNIHRDTARAFAADPLALVVARRAVAEGWDMAAPEPGRQFFYIPFEHSEQAEDQVLAVRYLTERLPSDPETGLHARAHQQVIARFGRFPTRNAALGRCSTPQELQYLAAGGYGAVVRALQACHAQDA